MIGCRVAMLRSYWSAVPTPLFIYISQLLRDSFSVSKQPPIWEPPSQILSIHGCVFVVLCCVVIVMILRGRELRKLALSPPATLLPHLDIYQQLDRDIIWNIVTSHQHSAEIRFWPCWRCIQLQGDE